jgi:membrane protein
MSQAATDPIALRRATIARGVRHGDLRSYLVAMAKVARAAGNAWLARRAASKGAALALYILFSLAPMLILLVAVGSVFFDEATVRAALLAQLGGLIGTSGGEALNAIVAGAKRDGDGAAAGMISAAIVLATATSAFAELKDSLDELWQLPATSESGIWSFLKERILSFGLLMVLALMLTISLAINAALAAFQGSWVDPSDPGKLMQYAFGALSMVIVTAIFAIIYKYLPATRIAWSDLAVGAILTSVLFMAGKLLIGLYLGHGNFTSAYGAAGSIVALITWIYYSAQIFFFGALFTHEYAHTLGSRRTELRKEGEGNVRP